MWVFYWFCKDNFDDVKVCALENILFFDILKLLVIEKRGVSF